MSQRYLGGVITANPTAPTTTTANGVWTLEQQFQNDANWPKSSAVAVSRSVRLRSSASAYFNRTPASAGSQQKFTFSCWLKRGQLGVLKQLFFAGTSTTGFQMYFNGSGGGASATDAIELFATNATTTILYYTSQQVLRDPSAWYHVILSIDTTQTTAGNRVLLWVNNQLVTITGVTSVAQNTNLAVNTTVAHYLGQASSTNYFDGYLTEINFIDGQALDPTYFGFTDSSGIWQPSSYTGTYGTNGFYLNFSDNSAATAAAIGKDYSGNGNNWTPNNISVTAGLTYDSMLDVPVNYADGGNGRGNYPVANPLIPTSLTYSNGNLTTTNATASWYNTRGTMQFPSTGKFYYEQVCTSGSNCWAGIGNENTLLTGNPAGYDANSYGYSNSGQKLTNSTSTAYGNSFTTNDVIGVAFDAATGSVWFSKNGTWQNSGDPAAGTNYAFTGITGNIYPIFSSSGSGATVVQNYNFGQRPFTYTPPSGFVALNTQNLPTPTISNGANYMAATTYTGTGATRSITNTVNGISFQPDFIWMKNRSNVADHALYDALRTAMLSSNTTAAEVSASNVITYDSNGFTISGGDSRLNANTNTYVGWQWKASGSTVSNTSGSITSTVSAGATQGFSVVTFTTASANATVGHGLGVAPKMIIYKTRATTSDWFVYHASLTSAAYYLWLDSTAAQTNSVNYNNSTAPTSSVFSVGTAWGSNTLVAYCFAAVAGYSAFGSYAGNNSSDGPFVYCGFRPRLVLIKNISSAVALWEILDTSRDTYNPAGYELYPNSSSAEGNASGAGGDIDFLSNGFKLRRPTTELNVANTYIYACFAENPFKISRAR